MGFFTSFATGALDRRADVRDDRQKEMLARENFMREALLRGAPQIAAKKEKNSQWNEAYNMALRAGATEAQARMHAMNPSTESWKELVQQINSVKYRQNLSVQSTAAAEKQPEGAPTPAPSPDNGYGSQDYPMEEINISANREPVAAPPTNPAFGPKAPGMQSGVNAPADFNSKTTFLEAILGHTSIAKENATIYRRLANEFGVGPQEVQEQYNTIMSGDFGFTPPPSVDDGKGVPFGNDPMEVETKAAQLIAQLKFDSSENMQNFRNAWVQGAINNDPAAMQDAYKYAMDDAAYAAVTRRENQRGQTTSNQFDKFAEKAVVGIMGGTWNQNPMTGETSFDFGATSPESGAIASQLLTQTKGDVLAQLWSESNGDFAAVPNEAYDKVGAVYFVLNALTEYNSSAPDAQEKLKAIKAKAEQVRRKWNVTNEDLKLAALNQQKRLSSKIK